jgi:hypothetical protein
MDKHLHIWLQLLRTKCTAEESTGRPGASFPKRKPYVRHLNIVGRTEKVLSTDGREAGSKSDAPTPFSPPATGLGVIHPAGGRRAASATATGFTSSPTTVHRIRLSPFKRVTSPEPAGRRPSVNRLPPTPHLLSAPHAEITNCR